MKQSSTALAAPPPLRYMAGVSPAPDKTAWRARLRALRRRLAAKSPDAALRAAELLPLDRLPAFEVFSVYYPMGSEMDPRPLMARLAATGASAALPATAARDAAMGFRLWDPREGLEPDAFGIPSPPLWAGDAQPDLVVAPVLGFDRHGHRLGQGAGHYDRALANLRALKPVFVLGLAFSGQEVADLPAEPHDERLDAILTETGYLQFG